MSQQRLAQEKKEDNVINQVQSMTKTLRSVMADRQDALIRKIKLKSPTSPDSVFFVNEDDNKRDESNVDQKNGSWKIPYSPMNINTVLEYISSGSIGCFCEKGMFHFSEDQVSNNTDMSKMNESTNEVVETKELFKQQEWENQGTSNFLKPNKIEPEKSIQPINNNPLPSMNEQCRKEKNMDMMHETVKLDPFEGFMFEPQLPQSSSFIQDEEASVWSEMTSNVYSYMQTKSHDETQKELYPSVVHDVPDESTSFTPGDFVINWDEIGPNSITTKPVKNKEHISHDLIPMKSKLDSASTPPLKNIGECASPLKQTSCGNRNPLNKNYIVQHKQRSKFSRQDKKIDLKQKHVETDSTNDSSNEKRKRFAASFAASI
jgi:hypothetical protein